MLGEASRPRETIGTAGVLALLVLNVALGVAVTVKGATGARDIFALALVMAAIALLVVRHERLTIG